MTDTSFHSCLQDLMVAFIAEKRAVGYRYASEQTQLLRLDRHLIAIGHASPSLPREVVEPWIRRRPNESVASQLHRCVLVRQFARFLIRHDIAAYASGQLPRVPKDFKARILTREEVALVLAAVDRLRPNTQFPKRHIVLRTIFRVLYGCGLRLGEARRLTVADVDLRAGVLLIRESKFRKDRLVPVSASLLARLRRYADTMGERPPTATFFPSPKGRVYSGITLYGHFRGLLLEAGIPHPGRGHGPRVHDLRHTFAVHRLESWYRRGEDLSAKLPILATYMGHRSLFGTQRYLQLTAELFPDIVARVDALYGHLIPKAVAE